LFRTNVILYYHSHPTPLNLEDYYLLGSGACNLIVLITNLSKEPAATCQTTCLHTAKTGILASTMKPSNLASFNLVKKAEV
jgi:hypothetical protein